MLASSASSSRALSSLSCSSSSSARRSPAAAPLCRRRPSSSSTTTTTTKINDQNRNNRLKVITFDLDDTIWPTTAVVTRANQAYIDWLLTRVQNFPIDDHQKMNKMMKRVKEERIEHYFRQNFKRNRETASPALKSLSYASIRIAAATKAMIEECDLCEHDAVGIASRGYHLSWIPARNRAGEELMFDGVKDSLKQIKKQYPECVIGSITNGLGSASASGLAEFFDFEISCDELIDLEGLCGETVRKPSIWPFQRALKMANDVLSEENYDDLDLSLSWVHVGDDVLNDCKAAKEHMKCRTVLVRDSKIVKYVSGGGAPWAERPEALEYAEKNKALFVDEEIVSVSDLPLILDKWYL